MRVLILSCNTGEGHNSCAKAIKEVLDIKGEYCVIEDSLRFISQRTSDFLSKGHVFVYRRIPWLFNFGYEYTENHAKVFKKGNMMYRFFARGADSLYKYIVQESFDTVICTHSFSALILTEVLERYSLKIKTAFTATDYTCSPGVKDSRLDCYFIPSEHLTHDFLCPHIPVEKVIPSGIPVRQMFYKSIPRDEVKRRLGISPENKHLVIMCGSMGCGPIEKLTETLAENLNNGTEITVICGTNEKLKTRLDNKLGKYKNLHIMGYVKDMSQMLDSADLYLTKAGGISVTEAAVKKVPMLFINAVAGCEDYNSTFYTRLGCAVSGGNIMEIMEKCEIILHGNNYYTSMTQAFDKATCINSAECIYTVLKKGAVCKNA